MKYNVVYSRDCDESYDSKGRKINGFVTKKINKSSFFGEAVIDLILKLRNAELRARAAPHIHGIRGDILITTEECWSGYSEYTVTSSWTEIVIGVPELGQEWSFRDLPTFFRLLANEGLDNTLEDPCCTTQDPVTGDNLTHDLSGELKRTPPV